MKKQLQKYYYMKYDDFDEYLRLGELEKRNKVQAWESAVGLQDVDSLGPSAYLLDTAKHHIKGYISINEVRELISPYYHTKSADPYAEVSNLESQLDVMIAKLYGRSNTGVRE